MSILHMALFIGLVLIAVGLVGLYIAGQGKFVMQFSLASWFLIVLVLFALFIEFRQIGFFAPPFQ